jgi:hypothetical protein
MFKPQYGWFSVIQSGLVSAFKTNKAKRLPTAGSLIIRGLADGLALCRHNKA